MRTAILAAALVILAAGCDQGAPPKKDGNQEAKKTRKEVTPSHPRETPGLWDVYASDAVVWRDQYQGRVVVLLLIPPYEIKRDEIGFYVPQPYQNGTETEAVRVRLREPDAERLSRITRGEEKVGRNEQTCVRAIIDDDAFAFRDGAVVLVKRP